MGIIGGISMGVFNGSINFAKIGTEMSKTYEQWLNASIQIVDPNVEEGTWNEWTNQKTGGAPTVIWSGPARIQHLVSDRMYEVGFSQTAIRGIRVQVPLDVSQGFIRKGLQIVVTDGGNDYELEQLQFVITSAVNSSYAWGRTIEAEVDMKSVANSTWSSISGNVSDDSEPILGATVRSFHHEDNLWIMDYETTTDVYGNYSLPADAGVAVSVVAVASGYLTSYYDEQSDFASADLITPTNHNETSGIDFVMVSD
jgi:hypothetical protein